MSTKSTITLFDGNASLHLYWEAFTDLVYLEYNQGFGMQVSLQLPLEFVMNMAEELPKHVKPIKELLNASDEVLRAQAKDRWAARKQWRSSSALLAKYSGTLDNNISDEEGIEEEYLELKRRQAEYASQVSSQGREML